MNAIVKIENQTPFIEVELNGKVQLGVNARDLHKMLEVKTDFSDWIKRRIGKLSAQLELITQSLSGAASFLSIHGKQTKPAMLKELDDLIKEAQPSLDFDEDKDNDK
ncbi:antA/AntB antirepressor family protein [Acinetobacter nosocomialis]|uniref:antA/AntB antirepressor family protein n=1 Tax=Acinetobacter nosocomialis TaxID=106654 RepID=UPI002D1F6745|nr:antA/AntB antirepressor family protein [Acinetobacter nosocomialis]MEB3855667.1 antA/AntB antirepressor family protein [Acinetobacter nosocomialis]